MDNNYEEWTPQQWLQCLRKRETVLADYLRTLSQYSGLPACDELVEKDMLKKYSRQTMEEALYSVFYPVNYIIHEWDKAPAVDGEEDEEMAEEMEELEKSANNNGNLLGDACYTAMVDVINRWIQCMDYQVSSTALKLYTAILTAMSMTASQLYACKYTKGYSTDALTGALLQHSIDKCNLITQCLTTVFMDETADKAFAEHVKELVESLKGLDCCLKKYLSEILAPGGRD